MTRSPSSPSGEALTREVFTHELSSWLRFDPLAREGRDPEGVHQLRVAARRLRAEMGVLTQTISQKPAAHTSRELRWIGGVLGRQRDLDVLYELLCHVEHEDVPFDASVLALLRRQRERERRHVSEALSSRRYQDLVTTLAAWAVAPPLRRRAHKSASSILRPGVLGGLGELFDTVDSLGPNPTDEDLHRVRIAIKHNRYRCEVATPALGAGADAVAKDLAKAQGVLGDLRDRVVARDFLTRWRASRWPLDEDESRREPVAIALSELSDEMAQLRRRWRAHVAHARRRSTALYLDDDGPAALSDETSDE